MADQHSKTPRNLITDFANNVNTRSGSSFERHQSAITSQGNDGEDPRRSARILERESPRKSDVKSTDKVYPGSGRKSQSRRSFRTPIQTIPLTSIEGRSASKSFVVGPDHWDIDTPRSNIEGLLAVADTQPRASHSEAKTSNQDETTPDVDRTFKVPPSSSKALKNAEPKSVIHEGSTPGSKYTPRTNIWNLLHIVQDAEQTPVERSTDLSLHHTRRSRPSVIKQKGWGQEVTLSPSILSRTSEGHEESLSFGRRKSVKRTKRSFHISVPGSSSLDGEDAAHGVDEETEVTDPLQRSLDKNGKHVLSPSQERNVASDLDEGIGNNSNDGSENASMSDFPGNVNDIFPPPDLDHMEVRPDQDGESSLTGKIAPEQHNQIEDNRSMNEDEDVRDGKDMPPELVPVESLVAAFSPDYAAGPDAESLAEQLQQEGSSHLVDTGDNFPFSVLRANRAALPTSEIPEGAAELPETILAYSRPDKQDFIISRNISEARTLDTGEIFEQGETSSVPLSVIPTNARDNQPDFSMKGGDLSNLTVSKQPEKNLTTDLEDGGAGNNTVNLSAPVLTEEGTRQQESERDNDLEINDILLSIRHEKASAMSPRDSLKNSLGIPGTPSRSVYDLSEGSSSSTDLELFEARTPKNLSKSKRWPSGSQSAEKTPPSVGKSASKSGKHRSDLSLTGSASKRPRLSYSEWKSLQMEKGDGRTTPRYQRAPRSSTPRDRAKQILHSTKLRLQTSILSHISQDLPDMSAMEPLVGISPIRHETQTEKQAGEGKQQPNTMELEPAEENESAGQEAGSGQVEKHSTKIHEDFDSSDDNLPEGISPIKTPRLDMTKRPRSSTTQKKAQRRSFTQMSSKLVAPRPIQKKARKGDKQPAKRAQKLPNTAMARSSVKFFAQRHTAMKLSKDAIEEIEKVSEIFWDDSFKALEAYAQHGGRKIVNEQDVILLMKTQRMIQGTVDLHDKIRELLPMELRAELIPTAKP